MMTSTPLAAFLASVSAVHASGGGTKETSYYTALNQLFDEVGGRLKPKVRCVMQLKNLGAGNPDGGFFTSDQFDRKTDTPKDAGKPARGVVEVKSPAEAVDSTATSKQVDKYWATYQLVLVTNLRDWLLLGERDGQRVVLERYTLATDDAAFWALARQPHAADERHGAAFTDFLTRVLLHNAPLSDPKDLAWLLASYAREARHRVEHAPPQAMKQLEALKSSLENALGVSFHAEKGAHFFRSTLVQTLFYGLFSAWVLRHEEGKTGRFDWHAAAHDLHVPMVAALFGQLSQPNKLKSLDLTEVLDWAGDALNRVVKDEFFKKFESTRSVQYFYEPFLEAFDPALRKDLGVWYTPEEIVRYQVARVDEVLRSELGLVDGLADPDVVVLDPCCGTGAYLVETLRLIAERLQAQGMDALAAHRLKQAVTGRLFGFELLPAPYVVAHLQIGLLLRHLGVPLQEDSDERAGIYLTNALTGWEPPKDPKQALPFPEFSDERDAADQVKQTQKILVVIGNPPYNAFGGVAQGEEQDLIQPYKDGLIDVWKIKKFNLDDLYIRFFRLAERRIAEQGGRGVVSYISNYSWTTEPSFVVLRQHLLRNFDAFWIENMHGNRKMSEYAPDGRTSETVFAQRGFSPGIRQGVVISTWLKSGRSNTSDTRVHYRDDLDQAKAEERRMALLATLADPERDDHYVIARPSAQNRFVFRPGEVGDSYSAWPTLLEIAAEQTYPGVEECRAGALFDMDRQKISSRMKKYFDKSITLSSLPDESLGLRRKSAGFDPETARDKVLSKEPFLESNIIRYATRPFDTRWCYHSNAAPLWNRSRPQLRAQLSNNRFLISRFNTAASPEGMPMTFTSALMDKQMISRNPGAIPFFLNGRLEATGLQCGLFAETGTTARTANLSRAARAYLAALGLPDPDAEPDTAEVLWMHALAIGYSPAYLAEHADGIRGDWPRIPLPVGREALLTSAAFGRQVAVLLDTETPVPGVTAGAIRDVLKPVAVISRLGGGPLQPEEFRLTAGWGHAGKAGVTMPGRGKLVARAAGADELVPALSGAGPGVQTHDIYLNDMAYWRNVPPRVWDFTIGGYQVLKKWLSYREFDLLGRAMTTDELQEVTAIARRLAALVMLQPSLDDNYRQVIAITYDWHPLTAG